MWGVRSQFSSAGGRAEDPEEPSGGNELAGSVEPNRYQHDPALRHAGSLTKGALSYGECIMGPEVGDRIAAPTTVTNFIVVPSNQSLIDSGGQVFHYPSRETGTSQLASSAPSTLPESLALMPESLCWYPPPHGVAGIGGAVPYNQSQNFQHLQLGNNALGYFPSLSGPSSLSNISSSLSSPLHNQAWPVTQQSVGFMLHDNAAYVQPAQFQPMLGVFGQPQQAPVNLPSSDKLEGTSSTHVQIQAGGSDHIKTDKNFELSTSEPESEPYSTEFAREKASRKREKIRSGKKQAGKPKRPLSAYNLFFKDERAKLLHGESSAVNGASEDVTGEMLASGSSSSGRKVGFAEMARIISSKWRKIDPETQAKYRTIAVQEMERYQDAKELYLQRQQVILEQSRALMESTVDDDTRKKYLARFASKSKCAGSGRKSKHARNSANAISHH